MDEINEEIDWRQEEEERGMMITVGDSFMSSLIRSSDGTEEARI